MKTCTWPAQEIGPNVSALSCSMEPRLGVLFILSRLKPILREPLRLLGSLLCQKNKNKELLNMIYFGRYIVFKVSFLERKFQGCNLHKYQYAIALL